MAAIKGQLTRIRAFSAIVRMADPNFDAERRREPAWEFESGRFKKTFYQNIRDFGPYKKTGS